MSTLHVKEYLHALFTQSQEPIYVYFCTNKDYNIVILFLLLP